MDQMDIEPRYSGGFHQSHYPSSYSFIQESPQQDAALVAQLADNYVAPIKRPLKQFTRKRKTAATSMMTTAASPSPPASPSPYHSSPSSSSPMSSPFGPSSSSPSSQPGSPVVIMQTPAKKQWHRPDPTVESDEARFCKACGITTTPQWRRGPDGERSLCNACGLHFYKIVQREKTVEKERKRQVGSKLPIEMLLNDPDF